MITFVLFWAFFLFLFGQGRHCSRELCREGGCKNLIWCAVNEAGQHRKRRRGNLKVALQHWMLCLHVWCWVSYLILPLHSWPVTFFIVWNVYLAPPMGSKSTKTNEFCKSKWARQKVSLKIMASYIPNHSNTHLKQRMYPAYGFIWCFSVQL